MAHSPDTATSWQERSVCTIQITSRESKCYRSSAERSEGLGDKGPNPSADPQGKTMLSMPRLTCLTCLPPHTLLTSPTAHGESFIFPPCYLRWNQLLQKAVPLGAEPRLTAMLFLHSLSCYQMGRNHKTSTINPGGARSPIVDFFRSI